MVRRQRPRYGIRWWVTQFCADRPKQPSPSISFREAMISRAVRVGKRWPVGLRSLPHQIEMVDLYPASGEGPQKLVLVVRRRRRVSRGTSSREKKRLY